MKEAVFDSLRSSVADPDLNPDPRDPYVFGPPGSGSGLFVTGMDPDPDPSIIIQK
jgi:hypothetical protein